MLRLEYKDKESEVVFIIGAWRCDEGVSHRRGYNEYEEYLNRISRDNFGKGVRKCHRENVLSVMRRFRAEFHHAQNVDILWVK